MWDVLFAEGQCSHKNVTNIKMDPLTWCFGWNFCEITVDIYLLKPNCRNTRTKCEICSKLTIKTPE